jgi:hypothetical protein
MKTLLYSAVAFAGITATVGSLGIGSLASANEPATPTADWQPKADNVASRVGELVEYGKAYGNDDAKLADAVWGLKEKTAAKTTAPAWSKKSSWTEGTGAKKVFFGVGVFGGSVSNRHLAFVVAENRARVEIAKLLNVTIARRSEANGWRSLTVTTSATLANVVIVDWYADSANIYALATYTKPVALEPTAPWIP